MNLRTIYIWTHIQKNIHIFNNRKMSEHDKVKVKIEIEIKQEIEDVYIKQEPIEETVPCENFKDLKTQAVDNRVLKTESFRDCKKLETVSSADYRNLKPVPSGDFGDLYLDNAIKQEGVVEPIIVQKSDVYHTPDQGYNGLLNVKPLVQEIINEIQNKVPETKSVQNKSKLKQKRPAKETGPYFCEFCQKQFQHESKLKRHLPVHTGQRPYVCHVCGKRFGESSYLKLHMLMHNGEKVFACHLCDKRFTHGSNLKRHQLTHTGERPYVCEVCNKGYSDRSTLKQHRRIHDGEKPYVCEVCCQGFPQSSQLKKHIMKHGAQPLFSNL